MRKLLLLLFIFTSCSSNETSSNETLNQDSIIKAWFFVKGFDIRASEESIANDCERKRTLVFKIDNTYSESFFYLHPSDGCISDGVDSGTYALNNSELTLKDSFGETFQYRIISVSQSELVIEYLEDEEVYTYNAI